MFYRAKDRLRRSYFSWRLQRLLHTPAIATGGSGSPIVLSQLQHKDVLLYLLAIKSFAQYVLPGAVHVVDDGSLTSSDRELLHAHVPRLVFRGLDEFRSPVCPTGGTWERLLAISELVRENYVIQLDSDTLTLGPLPEVARAIKESSGFVIGTWDNQGLEAMAEAQMRAVTKLGKQPGAHVQLVAEANFHRLSRYQSLRYVRGCSGFSGFPAGSFNREFIEAISVEMARSLGEKWHDWGSEQVMSNIVVANLPKSGVLPHPKYTDCQKMNLPETVFVHFIGSCRFKHGTYARLARDFIDRSGGS